MDYRVVFLFIWEKRSVFQMEWGKSLLCCFQSCQLLVCVFYSKVCDGIKIISFVKKERRFDSIVCFVLINCCLLPVSLSLLQTVASSVLPVRDMWIVFPIYKFFQWVYDCSTDRSMIRVVINKVINRLIVCFSLY